MGVDLGTQGSVCTTCPYCGVGCGVNVTSVNGTVKIKGDDKHPANFGKLCSKGYALADTLGNDNRLLSPRINGADVSWSTASKTIADKFSQVIEAHGPEAIAFYVSGQLLTEDYYVANKFVKGFLGTANIDTNSRLCMASSVAGHKRAFGSDTVPGCYEDIEKADLVVLVGSNLAWCHPVLFQRLEQARKNNPTLKTVVIDPRKTATAELADVHLAVRPGGESDAVLYAGLLRYLIDNNALDSSWITEHSTGFNCAAALSESWSIDNVAQHSGLSSKEIVRFYTLFVKNKKTVTLYSQGVNQSHLGTDTVNSIINVHLATGRIGREGCGPFSITGQPNAMGGREVGGLANMLACHMDIENPKHRSIVHRYWDSPTIASEPGLKAIDLFNAVRSGKIKALWVMATNPVVSMPLANDVARAIADCPFVVVSDVVEQTDTSMFANIQLPAQAWSEKSGTVSNSERRISRQRAFKTAPSMARPDWWAICQVAGHMGFKASFGYHNASEIFAEYAGLSSFENNQSRDFDIGEYAEINQPDYDDLQPFQWPKPKVTLEATRVDSARLFSDATFFTPDGKARIVAVNLDHLVDKYRINQSITHANWKNHECTLLLNTGRVRDHWHTMTRTGASARLSAHIGEPFAEINPRDADALNVDNASLVDVSNQFGLITVRALISDRTQSGSIFVPMHWNRQFASNANVNILVCDKACPVSGQPALKNQSVSVKKSRVCSYGFMLSRHKPDNLDRFDYWAIAPIDQGWKTEFASYNKAESIADYLCSRTEGVFSESSMVSYQDAVASGFRYCWFSDQKLMQAVYVSDQPVGVARQAVVSFLAHKFESQLDRLAAVSGVGFANRPDNGAIVCSCMSVGVKTIQSAIKSGCNTVERIGTACGAGTQCGSCRSEIVAMLRPVIEEHNELS